MFSKNKSNLPKVIYLLSCLALLAVLAGCSETAESNKPEDPCAGFPKTHGDLSYLRETSHPELSKEYALLIEQQHTPCQLVEFDDDPDTNVAAALRKAITKTNAEEILKETYFLTRRKRFEFAPLHLKRIKTLAEDYKYKNLAITEAVKLPNCTFEYNHTQGLMADDSFVEEVLAASRLQEIAAANYLYNVKSATTPSEETKEEPAKAPNAEQVAEKPKEKEPSKENAAITDPVMRKAVGCIQTIFTLANRLGQVKQVHARLIAESIREEACLILEALVQDPRCNKETLIMLQATVQGELAQWSSDAEMWIGDRALGLYIYEVVRDGLILSILSEEEEETFRQAGTLKYLTETTQETADEDQLYYLKTMRDLINKCDRDFYKRPLLGAMIAEDLESRENSLNYPIVAAEILLSGVDNALLLQMIDLTRIRAWSVALSIATGEKPQENINPISGEPFIITQTDKTVTVRAVPEGENAKINSPLNEKAKLFITRHLNRPVVVPIPQ